MKQIDERTIMFSRMKLRKGMKEYDEYYNEHPEHKEIDDKLRTKPNLCEPETPLYDEIEAPLVNANFQIIEHLQQMCEGDVSLNKKYMSPEKATEIVKKLALHFGADIVGITEIKPEHYYSHRGRREYGKKIENHHKYAIVFAMEMKKELVNRAPKMPSVIETSNIYLKLGVIGVQLAEYIRKLGYPARAHMDGNYQIIAPLVAHDAGLGEMGRHGLVLTEEFGGRVRLTAVTTDLPLVADKVDNLYLTEFCDACGICADMCPGQAIAQEKKEIDGLLRYQSSQEKCYDRWRTFGTDCGICLAGCPLSQGVDLELLKNKEFDKILDEYKEKYGARPFIRERYL